MLVVGVTNVEWFKLLRSLPTIDLVNFWRPGTANFKALQPGELFYFMLASPIRKVGGYGTFDGFEHMTILDAWLQFGAGNGVLTLQDFYDRMGSFESTVPDSRDADRKIGCVRLRNPVFLDDTEFKTTEELGIEFAPNIVAYKTYAEMSELTI